MQKSGTSFCVPGPVSLLNELFTVWDPEIGRTNPSEHKHLKLSRSLTRGVIDRDLKLSTEELEYVQAIIFFPFLFLTRCISSFLPCHV